jgi:hypothetical protein
MTLVHSAIQKAGGSIEIDSAPGRGTIVTLLLPAVAATEDPEAPPVESRPIAAVSFRDRRTQAIMTKLLQSMGYDTKSGAGPDHDRAAIWFTEAEAGRLDAARSFLQSRPNGRIAVAGALDEDWRRLGAVHLGETVRPSEIRTRLREFALSDGGQCPA